MCNITKTRCIFLSVVLLFFCLTQIVNNLSQNMIKSWEITSRGSSEREKLFEYIWSQAFLYESHVLQDGCGTVVVLAISEWLDGMGWDLVKYHPTTTLIATNNGFCKRKKSTWEVTTKSLCVSSPFLPCLWKVSDEREQIASLKKLPKARKIWFLREIRLGLIFDNQILCSCNDL